MIADSGRWDSRYRALGHEDRPHPCAVLEENRHLLPAGGRALDLACGRGGNALMLAAYGLETCAWDYSTVAIDSLRRYAGQLELEVILEVRNVVTAPPPSQSFDVIVVSHFLDRHLCPRLVDALRPGGLLFYQTFILESVTDHGPTNPAYRLAPNELLTLFSKLRLVFYREEGRIGDTDHGFRDRAQYIGYKTDDG